MMQQGRRLYQAINGVILVPRYVVIALTDVQHIQSALVKRYHDTSRLVEGRISLILPLFVINLLL